MGKLRKIEIYHNLTVNAPKGSYEWTKKLGQQHICLNTPVSYTHLTLPTKRIV